MSIITNIVLLLVGVLAFVNCAQEFTKDELFSLTRDGLSRENPDALLGGFFPVWPLILLAMAASFFVLSLVAFLGYVTGCCRSPPKKFVSAIDQ